MKRRVLTHGSLFAGIGGFDDGFRNAGMQVKWQVEIEPFCRAILRTRFPEAELLNDVTECGKHNLGAVDVLTAGFPCQDLSVAGKRAGLDGARSGLFWETRRIIRELEPSWFVIENVPGLFSSRGGFDFFAVISGLAELGYGLAWRVLDSQFFGVAQRRRRVFIVGSFGKPCPAEVLFESEGGEGDFAEGGETWAGVAREVGESIVGALKTLGGDGRGWKIDCEQAADGYLQTVPSLTSNGDQHKGFRNGEGLAFTLPSEHRGIGNGHNTNYIADIVPQAISSKWAKGSSGPAGDEHHNLIAIQDVRGHRDKKQNGIGIDASGGAMYALDGTSQHAVGGYLEHQERTCELGGDSGRDDEHDGGTDDECAAPNANGMRNFAGLPEGLDSARYRALGNAVTAKVANWIGRRIVACHEQTVSEDEHPCDNPAHCHNGLCRLGSCQHPELRSELAMSKQVSG